MSGDVKAFLPIRRVFSGQIPGAAGGDERVPAVWIDLENTPHVPFFMPVIRELRRLGVGVVVTARDAYQTCEMASYRGLDYRKIGRHWGRRKVAKVAGVLWRGGQLAGFALGQKPGLALHLGSRSQSLAAKLLGIPVVEIMDYEHTAECGWLRPGWLLMPEVVRREAPVGRFPGRVHAYRGLKEDVYVKGFRPDPALGERLGIEDGRVVVTVRPPATEAHYHCPASERLLDCLMARLLADPGVQVVMVPRNKRQERALRFVHPDWFGVGRVIVPSGVVDGLSLLWHSDLLLGGGGTMNREAAALGVPAYSFFCGELGAVDRQLVREGRLVLIETEEDVGRIPLVPRDRVAVGTNAAMPALNDIINELLRILNGLGMVRPGAVLSNPEI